MKKYSRAQFKSSFKSSVTEYSPCYGFFANVGVKVENANSYFLHVPFSIIGLLGFILSASHCVRYLVAINSDNIVVQIKLGIE